MSADADASEVTVEATGETVGEAKWKALRELERAAPGLDKASVRFQVVSEGERGLLGVGYTPARVVASTDAVPVRRHEPPQDESETARHVRELVETVVGAMGVVASVDVREDDEGIVATCLGDDLGVVIGKHGQTIDALQTVANAALFRGGGAQARDGGRGRLPQPAPPDARRDCRSERRAGGAGRAGRARADDRGRAQGRARAPEGRAGRGDRERGGRSRIATSSSSQLDDWLAAVVATPGLTAIEDLAEARRMLLDDSLRGVETVSPVRGPDRRRRLRRRRAGIPLAAALPEREVVLLEAERRKCDFLERWAPPNARVVWGRAEAIH